MFERITDRIRNSFGISSLSEFTVEVNPDDINAGYAAFLRECGVTRISMGIQSFDDAALKWMNRRYNASAALKAFDTLRKAGFNNISLDLIFGYRMLSAAQWEKNLETAAALAPEHISAYQMSLESGTPLYEMERKGEYEMPPQEECARQYSILQEKLEHAGYLQYEISNFCRKLAGPGNPYAYASLHNTSYWDSSPYLGLGAGAHSYSGIYRNGDGELEAIREWNIPNLKRYVEGGNYSRHEILSKREIFNESIMLGLRKTTGLRLGELKAIDQLLFREIAGRIEYLTSQGRLVSNGEEIKIPSEKLFVSDGIIRDLFV